MLSLFSGKISGVFTQAFQGFTKAIGFVLETVTTIVDTVVETVGKLTSPLTETLTKLPLVGETVESVLKLESNLLGNLSGGLHAVASDFSKGDLLGGVSTALGGVTATAGATIKDVTDVVGDLVALSAPITNILGDLPAIGPVVGVIGQTSTNLLGFAKENGDYVASINPVDLITGALTNPTGSLGGVLKDVSSTLDHLLDDLAPVTGSTAGIPVVGDLVGVIGSASGSLTQGIYDAGNFISKVDLFDAIPSSYV